MSSQLTDRTSLDAQSEMMLQEPSPSIIRWTAWLLLGAFLFALFNVIVMQLLESVHRRFALIAATGADPIQSSQQAVVSRVAVDEGQPCKVGYEISSHTVQALPLRVGMRGDAHIIVGGRALIEYAFEPIRRLRESIKQ